MVSRDFIYLVAEGKFSCFIEYTLSHQLIRYL